jgi:hypothetical protein
MKIKLMPLFFFTCSVVFITACEKSKELDVVEATVKESIAPKEVSVEELKAFMYELNHFPISEIVYDEKTEKFFFLDVEQYTRKDLTKYYFIFKERKENEKH